MDVISLAYIILLAKPVFIGVAAFFLMVEPARERVSRMLSSDKTSPLLLERTWTKQISSPIRRLPGETG